jgi:hypothetical protein
MDDDPFDTPEVQVLRRGRYMLPRLDGTKQPRGWMRVSNLVSAYSDQYALRVWEHLEVLQAIVNRPDLLEAYTAEGLKALKLQPFGERQHAVEAWLAKTKAVSGGDEGSNFGTQRHAAVEQHHEGLPAARHDAGTRRHLALYASALERNGLVALPQMQERIIHVPVLEACGRIDNILAQPCNHNPLEDCGECFNEGWTNPVIGDLKTARRFWTWLEIGAQFACYANAEAMWDAQAGRWVDMPHVSKDIALVLWMPRVTEDGEPRVDIYEVDIRKGWKTAQRAYEVVKDRAEAKSVRGGRAWLRAAPPADDTERWAARFAAVDSHAEGKRLVAAAVEAGVWGPALAQSAKLAAQRLDSLPKTE